jgi:hypothetical protein
MKQFIGAILFLFILSGAAFGERTLKPYQDYLIILVHGLNDNRTSFVGENEAQSTAVRKQRDMQEWLAEELDIPIGYIWAYSYAESRGSNIENAQLLGNRGYRPNAKEGQTNPGYNVFRQIAGDAAAVISMNDHPLFKEERLEYWSYDPALDKYIATNIEPGNTILEQAKKDFKQWYFESDLNKVNPKDSRSDKIIQKFNDPRLDAVVPRKYILMPHSMGNLSTRLYIYSDELAADGKFFDKGFYKGDVEKVVFLAAPLRGSDLAVATVMSPIGAIAMKVMGAAHVVGEIGEKGVGGIGGQMWGELGSVFSRLASSNVSDVSFQYLKWLDTLKDPWLTLKNPYWSYIYAARYMDMMQQTKDLLDSKSPIETLFGIRGDARYWNPAARELMPDEIDLPLISDVSLELYKMNGPNDIVKELRRVRKADRKDEPLYSVVYGTGYPVLNIKSTLLQISARVGDCLREGKNPLKDTFPYVNDCMFNAKDPLLSNWHLVLDADFQKLSGTQKMASLMWKERFAGMMMFTHDGDAAVPEYSGKGDGVAHLEGARRIEKRFEDEGLNEYYEKTVPVLMGAVEVLGLAADGMAPGSGDYVRAFGRFGIVFENVNRAMFQGADKLRYLGGIHGEILAAKEEVLRGLMDVPYVSMKDSLYLANREMHWSGIYAVTQNAVANPELGDAYQPVTVNIAGRTLQMARVATLNEEVAGDNDLQRVVYNPSPSLELQRHDEGDKRLSVVSLSDDEIVIRGVVQDLSPQKLVRFELSENFSGWLDVRSRVQADGRFELGPIRLYEGQNVLAFKLENMAGYSSNQVLKILKTGITLQPVLDEIYPIPESHVRGEDIAVRLV